MRYLLSLRVLSLAILTILFVSCSTGPSQPKPGSPAFFFGAAELSYKTGDFAKAAENLAKIPAADTEFRPKADVWQMVLAAGLAKADMEWSDSLAAGAKLAKDRQLAFLKDTNAARTSASQHAMRFAELADRYMEKYKDEEVTLAFTKSTFAPDKPGILEQLAKGQTLTPAELDKAHDAMLKRGVRLETEFVGAADAPTKIKRPEFLTYLAQTFVDLAELYQTKKLNHAGRLKMLTDEAKEAIGDVPASDTTKKLKARIEMLLSKQVKD